MRNYWLGKKATVWDFNTTLGDAIKKKYEHMYVRVVEVNTGICLRSEPHHPMLCVHHGGSPACEEENKKYGFTCPKCLEERWQLPSEEEPWIPIRPK